MFGSDIFIYQGVHFGRSFSKLAGIDDPMSQVNEDWADKQNSAAGSFPNVEN